MRADRRFRFGNFYLRVLRLGVPPCDIRIAKVGEARVRIGGWLIAAGTAAGGLRPLVTAIGVVGIMLVWLAVSPSRAAAACPEWNKTSVYPFPFDPRLGAWDLPGCREPAPDRRTQDYGQAALGRDLIMDRQLGTLKPDANGQIRWPMRDSLGRDLAVLVRYPDRWVVLDPKTSQLIYTDTTLDPDQLVVQGRGCMADDALEGAHALIAFDANDRTTIPSGTSIVPYRLRAFIPRQALPADVRSAVDSYWTGCGEPFGRVPGAPGTLADPSFDSNTEKYYGEDGVARTYANYNVKAPYNGARYLLINTTGVGGGGLVRGVIQQGELEGVSDSFGYCDPNFVNTLPAAVATWDFGQLETTRVWGWFARRCPGTATGTAPVNTSPPSISGTAREGSQLTANPGTWTGNDPINYTYQWRRCDAAGVSCADIAGATATTYLLTSADVGATVRVRETATNSAGNGSADAAPTAQVQPAQGTATITGFVRDSATGKAIARATVNCDTYGTRTNKQGSYSLQPAAPATYTCVATASGYLSSSHPVTVAADQSVQADFALTRR